MSTCNYFRFFLALSLINFIIFSSLFFCIFYKNESRQGFYLLVLILLICFFSINFLLVYFWAKLIDYNNKSKKIKSKCDLEISSYLDNLSEKNKLVKAAKASLGVYHDLANILTASNFAINNAISESAENKGLSIFLKRISNINERANYLIGSFKRQFNQEGFYSYFSPASEIKACLNIFNFYFIKNKINVKTNLNKKILIFGDPVKFSQIIINLLDNSIDSFDCNQRNRNIFISFKALGPLDDLSLCDLELFFRDSGRGICEDYLKNVFEPFFSSKKDSSSCHCGVGLTLIKKIVEEDFSGRVHLSSSLGEGTKFKLFFPKIKKQP